MLLLIGAITTGVVLAASSVFNLGKPTNAVSTNPYFPLSGFRHVKGLQPSGKTRVFFIGTLLTNDSASASERWPLVKALQQFGKFSHLKPFDRICLPNADARRTICSIPSFDWSHASYHSKVIRFSAAELMHHTSTIPGVYGLPAGAYQRMNSEELSLYRRFTHVPLTPAQQYDPYNTSRAVAEQHLPVVVVGNYAEVGPSQVVHPADFQEQLQQGGPPPTPDANSSVSPPAYPSGLPFNEIQQALQTQQNPKGTTLAQDVNAETNIITAIICKADGQKPGAVCNRSVISSLMRRIR